MERITQLKDAIERLHKGSEFDSISPEEIDKLREDYPGFPDDLATLYASLGYGRIGDSRYMIHFPQSPEGIYGDPVPEQLTGIMIVGDDYAGNCDAYDTKNGWLFGTIGSDARFKAASEVSNFVEFLLDWHATPENI